MEETATRQRIEAETIRRKGSQSGENPSSIQRATAEAIRNIGAPREGLATIQSAEAEMPDAVMGRRRGDNRDNTESGGKQRGSTEGRGQQMLDATRGPGVVRRESMQRSYATRRHYRERRHRLYAARGHRWGRT